MLSARVYFVIGKFLSLLNYFGATPYRWDSLTQNLQNCPQSRRKNLYLIFSHIFIQSYILEEMVGFYCHHDLKNFNFCYLFLIGNFLLYLGIAIQHFPNDAWLVTFNSVLNYIKRIGKLIQLQAI